MMRSDNLDKLPLCLDKMIDEVKDKPPPEIQNRIHGGGISTLSQIRKSLSPYFNFSRSLASISTVIESKSYFGAQSHSLRAHESSREFGHEFAIPWRSSSIS